MSDGRLVNPMYAPIIKSERVTDAAEQIRKMGASVKEHVTSLNSTWKGLRSCYHSPEQELVYALQDPAQEAAEGLDGKLSKAADLLDEFASALASIKPNLEAAKESAQAFRDKALEGWYEYTYTRTSNQGIEIEMTSRTPPVGVSGVSRALKHWSEDPNLVNQNSAHIKAIDAQVSKISIAEAECADSINQLVGGMCYVPSTSYTERELIEAPSVPWGGVPRSISQSTVWTQQGLGLGEQVRTSLTQGELLLATTPVLANGEAMSLARIGLGSVTRFVR